MPTRRRTAQLFEFQTLVYKSRMTLKDVLVRIHSSACSDELSQYRLNVVEEVLDPWTCKTSPGIILIHVSKCSQMTWLLEQAVHQYEARCQVKAGRAQDIPGHVHRAFDHPPGVADDAPMGPVISIPGRVPACACSTRNQVRMRSLCL